MGGYLTSDDIDFTQDGLAEVYVWKNKYIDDEWIQSSDLFEIEVSNNFNWGRDIQSCENKNYEETAYPITYRLRHLVTGWLVGCQNVRLINGDQVKTLGLIKQVNIDEGESGKGLDEIS